MKRKMTAAWRWTQSCLVAMAAMTPLLVCSASRAEGVVAPQGTRDTSPVVRIVSAPNSGNLLRITDPSVQVTSFERYDRYGNVLQSTDADGVVTVNAYDLRQRLFSAAVGGEPIRFGFDPVGQLEQVLLPNGSLGRIIDALGRVQHSNATE